MWPMHEAHGEFNRHIHVACAIIECNGFVLAVQRSPAMSMPLKWEFPGGKIEPHESPEECVQRELLEELGLQINIGRQLPTSTYRYPTFTITLYPFACSIQSGEMVLHEHSGVLWLSPEKLFTLDWAEADTPVINDYCISLNRTAL